MKKIALQFLFCFIGTIVCGQQLTLDDLLKFTTKEPEEINNILEKKGWFFNGQQEHEGENFIQFKEPVKQVTWIFNLNDRNDNSRSTHTLIYYEYFEFKNGKSEYEKWELKDVEIRKSITLMTHSKLDYNNLKKVTEQRFKKTDDKLLGEVTLKIYDGLTSWIWLGYGTEKPTLYNVSLRAKKGI